MIFFLSVCVKSTTVNFNYLFFKKPTTQNLILLFLHFRSPRKQVGDQAPDVEVGGAAAGGAGPGGPVQANIRVAVRVRPENERELAACHR